MSVSIASRVSSAPVMMTTSSTWLTRLSVSVTVFEKSAVSDVTLLTIFPDENSSKNDMSRAMTARIASRRSPSTTSPHPQPTATAERS
jgi:hypothetical protein